MAFIAGDDVLNWWHGVLLCKASYIHHLVIFLHPAEKLQSYSLYVLSIILPFYPRKVLTICDGNHLKLFQIIKKLQEHCKAHFQEEENGLAAAIARGWRGTMDRDWVDRRLKKLMQATHLQLLISGHAEHWYSMQMYSRTTRNWSACSARWSAGVKAGCHCHGSDNRVILSSISSEKHGNFDHVLRVNAVL